MRVRTRPCRSRRRASRSRCVCGAVAARSSAVGEQPGTRALHSSRFDDKRQLNGSSTMADATLPSSVFDRLLKDRIIWLGSEVRDDNANEIAAKLLLLAAEDPKKDIYLYINSPGGSITAGMAIYDTMQFVPERHRHRRHRHGRLDGPAAADRRHQGQALHHAERARAAAPAARRIRRHLVRHPDPGAAHPRHEEAPRRDHRRADRQDRRADQRRRRPRPLVHRPGGPRVRLRRPHPRVRLRRHRRRRHRPGQTSAHRSSTTKEQNSWNSR